jgi:DNA polymerase-3 subunit gamma/tau
LARILGAEDIPFEEAALHELARAADGSMRDGLSLLDQAIAYGGGRVVAQDVHAMLGTLPRDRVYDLLDGLVAGDAAAVIATIETLAQHSPDWSALLGELVGLLQRVALAQLVPEAVDDTLGDRERVLAVAARMTPEDVQLHYQIGLLGRRDLPLVPQPRSGFEMVLLRMLAFRPLPEGAGDALSPTGRPTAASPPRTSPPAVVSSRSPAPSVVRTSPAPVSPATGKTVVLPADLDWLALVETLGLTGTPYQLALNCALARVEETTLRLTLAESHRLLFNKERERRVEQAVQARFGPGVRVAIGVALAVATPTPAQILEQRQQEREAAARAAIEQDPYVQAFREVFDAEIDPQSIHPLG